jgi:hypothetical protein
MTVFKPSLDQSQSAPGAVLRYSNTENMSSRTALIS